MAFLVGGANSAVSGYDIDNSCRFDSASNPVLSFDTGTATLGTKCTLSLWFKRSKLDSGTTQYWLLGAKDTAESNIKFKADKIEMHLTGSNYDYSSTRLFRDSAAWYHLVFSFDTTQGTAANRVKMWVNGEAETLTTSGGGAIPQNDVMEFNKASLTHTLGAHGDSDHPSDGYMAEVYFVDGTAYDADDFGETDSDSGIWKPKSASVTFGNNGYYMEFKASAVGSGSASTIGADTSGEDNHLTSANLATTDQCTDTPTNNFATLRIARDPAVSGAVLSEGNTAFVTGSSGGGRNLGRSVYGTIAVNEGKWYFETKVGNVNGFIGVAPDEGANIAASTTDNARFVGYYPPGNGTIGQIYTKLQSTESYPTYGNQSSVNDVLGFAVDMDNKLIYVRNSGGWADDSGNWDEANPNESSSINFDNNDTHLPGYVVPWFSSSGGATSSSIQWNFGSPPFAISSSNADANGYGNFEYAVPSGFYALCSKNLAEFG